MVAMHTWDPDQYLAYADERGRPFIELISRIGAQRPADVVDLGCGPGNLTRLLTERWPSARVSGVDSSAEMIAKARADHTEIGFAVSDLREWMASVDVIVSNATLQWIPGHLELLSTLIAKVRPGGWLAFQVPGNFAEPSHTILRELGGTPPYAEFAAGAVHPAAHDARTYLEALAGAGCTVDAWETTYLHVLQGPDPVFAWISGTGARPTLQALPDGLREEFIVDYKERLRVAYPPGPAGVVLPFRRVFVVAQVPQ